MLIDYIDPDSSKHNLASNPIAEQYLRVQINETSILPKVQQLDRHHLFGSEYHHHL